MESLAKLREVIIRLTSFLTWKIRSSGTENVSISKEDPVSLSYVSFKIRQRDLEPEEAYF